MPQTPSPSQTDPEAEAGYVEARRKIKRCLEQGKRGLSLDLTSLKLRSLPPEIGQLSSLTWLNLHSNQLRSLPPEIGQLSKLTELFLHSNQLSSLPPEIGQLSKLTRLYLGGNQLRSLPPEIGQISSLTELYLESNRLSSLPPEIGQLSSLTRLYLGGNQLRSLHPEIGRLASLTELSLSDNQLSSLPPEIGQLSSLTRLYLDSNQLSSLPPEIGQLSWLTVLYLGSNQLSSLPPEIGQLSKLTVLYLRSNQLSSLPPEMAMLASLKELYLHDNSSLGISAEVLGPSWMDVISQKATPADPRAILRHYFARVAGQTRPLNEVKLILVGDGGRGKTETVNLLLGRDFGGSKTEETVGINIEDWELPVAGAEPVNVHVWDFAGQTVTHGLHKFFLSQRSVYVLVLAGRDDKAQAEAEYWLQLIRAFATHDETTSPVIITLNKWMSLEEKAKVDRRGLQEKFPFIAGFVETDCKTGHGLERLKEMIQEAVAADPWVRQPFEKAWWEAKEYFRQMKVETLRYEDYQQECARLGVSDPQQQQDLARRLHDLGLALNFGADPRLRLWTVLNPHWVTRTIYKLLRQGPAEGTGLMTCADVMRELPQETAEQWDYLVQLMEEFDLAFAVGDEEDQWLVPQRLETDTPELPENLKSSAAVRLRWRYTALPEGLLPEFITRTHVLSDELSHLRWANGVMLKMEDACVLVRADREDKTITAIAAHPYPELMRHVEGELDALNSEIPGLQVEKEMEVLPGAWLKVALLRKMEPTGGLVPVTVKNARGDEDLEMVAPREQLNRISLERSRDETAWRPLVFISYTDRDRKMLDTLCQDYLSCHEHNGFMEIWYDRLITPGTEWSPEILRRLAEADVILFLLSPRALGSRYIRTEEIPRALERYRKEGTPVIPVLLQEADLSATGLGAFEGFNELWNKPVRDWKPQRKAWYLLSQELKKLCMQLLEGSPKRGRGSRPA